MTKKYIVLVILLTSIQQTYSQTNFIFNKSVDSFLRKKILEEKAETENISYKSLLVEYNNQYFVFSDRINDNSKFDSINGLYTVKFASTHEPISVLIIKNKALKCYTVSNQTDIKKLTIEIIDFLKSKKLTNAKMAFILREIFNDINISIENKESQG